MMSFGGILSNMFTNKDNCQTLMPADPTYLTTEQAAYMLHVHPNKKSNQLLMLSTVGVGVEKRRSSENPGVNIGF